MAPFPLINLGYLAVKQISKPLAEYIKKQAKSSPLFRKYVCIPPAQFYHHMEINIKLRLLGLGSAQTVDKLSEKEAIELGGDMLGEFLVFFFASLILISEYQRSSRKEAAKEEKRKQEQLKILNRFQELERRGEIQEVQIREMQNQLDTILNQKELKVTEQFKNFVKIF